MTAFILRIGFIDWFPIYRISVVAVTKVLYFATYLSFTNLLTYFFGLKYYLLIFVILLIIRIIYLQPVFIVDMYII